MNKILNINLGGIPFTIDFDAYDHLDNYLNTIRRHFSESESCEEIMHDIEVRMGELFQESLKGTPIISTKELDEVIRIMGTPEDFGAESMDDDYDYEPKESRESYSERSHKAKTGKRLFRDEDDKVIAGVCSGLAAYFGIEDPLWVRIGFVLLFFAGVSPILYPLLWAIVPKAKTASDRLAMKGETINISNIAKTVEDEISELSKRITEIGKDLKSKKKSNDSVAAFGGSFSENVDARPKRNLILRAIASIFTLIGKVFGGVVKLIKGIFKPIFKLVGGTMSLALLLALLAFLIVLTLGMPAIMKMGPDSMVLNSLSGVSLYLTIGIPLFMLLTTVSKLTFGYKMNGKWARNLGLMWVGAVVLSALGVVNTAKDYGAKAEYTENVIHVPHTDQVKLVLDQIDESGFNLSFGNVMIDQDKILVDQVYVQLEPSEDENIHVISEFKARGNNKKAALANAEKIMGEVKFEKDGTLTVPSTIQLPKSSKFRGQSARYTIQLPVGMNVEYDRGISSTLYRTKWTNLNRKPRKGYKYGWTMNDDGLSSIAYQDVHNHKKQIPVGDIEKLFVEGDFTVEIAKSEDSHITLEGYKHYVDEITVETMDDIVTLTNPSYDNVKLIVNVRQLDQLHLDKIRKVRFNGFIQDKLAIFNKGRGDITGTLQVDDLSLDLEGRQDIDFIGKGKNLLLSLKGNPILKLDKYLVNNANIKGQHREDAHLSVDGEVTIDERLMRFMDIKGSPKIQAIQSSETM